MALAITKASTVTPSWCELCKTDECKAIICVSHTSTKTLNQDYGSRAVFMQSDSDARKSVVIYYNTDIMQFENVLKHTS